MQITIFNEVSWHSASLKDAPELTRHSPFIESRGHQGNEMFKLLVANGETYTMILIKEEKGEASNSKA